MPANQRPVEILSTHTPALFHAAVARAAALLQAGGIVALPTETVYGLAANALDPAAVRRIYEVKGRPRGNPVIVHVAGIEMARRCVREWPGSADRLAEAFWPGPLTLVLRRAGNIPDAVTASGDTVGLRWPRHPFIQELIRFSGLPLAAPSANRANQTSPTTAAHVVASLGDRIPLVVDGGPSEVGIESTVVDLTGPRPRVLRPGVIHEEAIAAVVGEVESGPGSDRGVLRSPGRLPRHYAPRACVRVLTWENEADLRACMERFGADPATVHVIAHQRIPAGGGFGRVCVIPHDPAAYARALYAEWHRCDELGARWILVEAVPDEPAWRGIADRLARAATPP